MHYNFFTFFQTGIGMIMLVLVVIVHGALALAIYRDAEFRRTRQADLFLVGPSIWLLATLLSGVTGVLAYWLIHYSKFRMNHKEIMEDLSNNSRQAAPDRAPDS